MLHGAFNGTQLLEQTTIAQVGSPGTHSAGQWNYPRFKGTLMLGCDFGDFSAGWNTYYISRSRYSATDQSDETRDEARLLAGDAGVRGRLRETPPGSLPVTPIPLASCAMAHEASTSWMSVGRAPAAYGCGEDRAVGLSGAPAICLDVTPRHNRVPVSRETRM